MINLYLEIAADGAIKPAKGVQFSDLTAKTVRLSKTDVFGKVTREVVYTRDSNGDLSSIVFNELEYKQWAAFDSAITAQNVPNSGTQKSLEFKFKTVAGKCALEESVQTVALGPEGSADKKRLLYNTELCAKIGKFLIAHPETKACFDENLNRQVREMMEPYKKDGDLEKPMIKFDPTPVTRAYSMLERCYFASTGIFEHSIQFDYNNLQAPKKLLNSLFLKKFSRDHTLENEMDIRR